MRSKIDVKSSTNALRERTETLKRYYEDIRKYNVLSRDEEVMYFNMYNNGINQQFAFDKIINSNQRFVVGVAKRYATNDNMLDLIEEGNVGLIEAFHKYDVTSGNKFISYAVHYIRRAINTYLVKQNDIILRSNNHKIYHLANKARNIFMQEEHRNPTPEELLDVLNKRFDANLRDAGDLNDIKFLSIDMNYDSEHDIHCDEMACYNEHTASINTYENKTESDFNSFIINRIVDTLSNSEQTVLKMFFGIGFEREHDMEEIAYTLGVSQERVRQLKKQGLVKLQDAYKAELNKF